MEACDDANDNNTFGWQLEIMTKNTAVMRGLSVPLFMTYVDALRLCMWSC